LTGFARGSGCVPAARSGLNDDYAPQIVKKNQTRWTGFDDKILSMYARGMPTRDI
jgi:putative transposase